MQQEQFGLYALYSKNKPKSDALLSSHGSEFFRVSEELLKFPHVANVGSDSKYLCGFFRRSR